MFMLLTQKEQKRSFRHLLNPKRYEVPANPQNQFVSTQAAAGDFVIVMPTKKFVLKCVKKTQLL